METLLTSEGIFFGDNGASTFVPLWNYFIENNTLEPLRNSGKRVYVHSIVTGGQAMQRTESAKEALRPCTRPCPTY